MSAAAEPKTVIALGRQTMRRDIAVLIGIIRVLIRDGQDAGDWLIDAQENTDQWERGRDLLDTIVRSRALLEKAEARYQRQTLAATRKEPS